ncbi:MULTISPECIES: ABC transporter ATP-binding protein [Streptomyces]|uniref:Lipid A export ATP-binding or permease protein MsbA n=4 Tax=Streptomyces venezuelae TaxID=54571 RepID=F2R134_STRVP|nr:ABC transporter ATP-binding protein [Streptomyces venezuelae]APE21513.1 multidrug ABC transporter ATP-binding protein [Streptomyces venezuelae]QER98898.1 ABC transporter ATP-binding protein [Streptomyces venezuelae ATCC 10712]CCA55551.1 Lipid A export ATP-binding or permease protein MsbA [Streptomyces venezuelae ATCC 10712]
MLLRLLRPRLRPYRPLLVLLIALQLVQTLASLALPALNAGVIDQGVLRGDTGRVLSGGATMAAVTLLQAAAAAAATWTGAKIAMGVARDLRSEVFRRVQEFSAQERGRFGAASLITRTTNDIQQVQAFTVLVLTMLVAAPLLCVGGIAMALRQDVPLALVLLLFVPVMTGAVGTVVLRMRPLFRGMQQRVDRANRVLREQITGVRVVRAFVRDRHERQRFAAANDELLSVGLRAGRLQALMFPTVLVLWQLTTVALVYVGAHRIDSGALQPGGLVAFLGYLLQTSMSVMMVLFLLMHMPRAQAGAERVREVLDTRSSVVPPVFPVRAPESRGHLEVRSADFRYPGAEESVLKDVGLVARPGETTAIIGSTGSGKSTLLGLVPRLFDATGGEVLVDGVDVRDLDPRLMAKTVGLVPQKPYLFSGTVATNLRYGKPDATDEELWHALEVAQAADFVRKLEHGLGAPVSQGGTNFSGGQRQRLAIARVLVARPRLYLFDDSFSALDPGTDARLRAALREETADATVVIVAQRVSTIRQADRIVVLDRGRSVGTGTHTSLMRDSATYREIVLSQLTEEEAA